MDADSSVSADLVLVALSAPRSRPPPALSCHVTRDGPPPVGPVRSTPERTHTHLIPRSISSVIKEWTDQKMMVSCELSDH